MLIGLDDIGPNVVEPAVAASVTTSTVATGWAAVGGAKGVAPISISFALIASIAATAALYLLSAAAIVSLNLLTAFTAFAFAEVFMAFNAVISSALQGASVFVNIFIILTIARACVGLLSRRSKTVCMLVLTTEQSIGFWYSVRLPFAARRSRFKSSRAEEASRAAALFVSAAAFSAVASSLIIVCSAAAAARLLADSAAGEPEGAGDVGEVRGPVMKGGVAWEEIIILRLTTESYLTDNINAFSRTFGNKAVFLIVLDIDAPIYADIFPLSPIFLQGIHSVQL